MSGNAGAVYFNEFDAYPARWLANLYPDATIDDRSIADVGPNDVTGTRAHFFAGIGGWEYALDLAGWPADREVWTGSCPCQPFSAAGRGLGAADPRHLWPEFYRLIAERRPATVFGEQVAGRAGRAWLAGVRADLEALGYAVGAADLCAAGVGAPHIRQRLYWVADAIGERIRGDGHGSPTGAAGRDEGTDGQRERLRLDVGTGGAALAVRLPDTGHAIGRAGDRSCDAGRGDVLRAERQEGPAGPSQRGRDGGAWDGCIVIATDDGKARRVESSVFPLAHGVSARASKLRAYGNAIVPQVAAVFIRAFMDCEVTA